MLFQNVLLIPYLMIKAVGMSLTVTALFKYQILTAFSKACYTYEHSALHGVVFV